MTVSTFLAGVFLFALFGLCISTLLRYVDWVGNAADILAMNPPNYMPWVGVIGVFVLTPLVVVVELAAVALGLLLLPVRWLWGRVFNEGSP
jgi:hypothetical protein